MKKFTKIVLILSAVFIVLGMALMIGTGILGDLYYGNMKLDSVGIDLHEASEFVEHGEDWMEHELRAMFGENADSQTGRIAGNEIRELDLSVKAARVKIVRDDKIDGISILNSSKQLDVKHSIEENTLHLEIAKKDESKSVGSFDGTEVKLMIPSHMSFDDLEIDLSAGELTAEQLSAEERAEILARVKNKRYDLVLTHTAPITWEPTDLFLRGIDQSTVEKDMEYWLKEVALSVCWGHWLFGHYHADRVEAPHVEQFFQEYEDLDTIINRWKRYDETGELDWWIPKSPYMQGLL